LGNVLITHLFVFISTLHKIEQTGVHLTLAKRFHDVNCMTNLSFKLL